MALRSTAANGLPASTVPVLQQHQRTRNYGGALETAQRLVAGKTGRGDCRSWQQAARVRPCACRAWANFKRTWTTQLRWKPSATLLEQLEKSESWRSPWPAAPDLLHLAEPEYPMCNVKQAGLGRRYL